MKKAWVSVPITAAQRSAYSQPFSARKTAPSATANARSVRTRRLSPASAARAEGPAGYGPELEGFEYPFPVERFAFESQRQTLAMGYMDIAPARPNGRTVVLLHGKNFCGATWEGTIARLADAGYRVIAPDQIGFCRSTKPAQSKPRRSARRSCPSCSRARCFSSKSASNLARARSRSLSTSPTEPTRAHGRGGPLRRGDVPSRRAT